MSLPVNYGLLLKIEFPNIPLSNDISCLEPGGEMHGIFLYATDVWYGH